MNIKTVTTKFGNMRKDQKFVVYPNATLEEVIVQSDTVFARINPKTGEARFVNNKNRNNSVGLMLEGKTIMVPMDIVNQFVNAVPRSGDRIGPGVYIA